MNFWAQFYILVRNAPNFSYKCRERKPLGDWLLVDQSLKLTTDGLHESFQLGNGFLDLRIKNVCGLSQLFHGTYSIFTWALSWPSGRFSLVSFSRRRSASFCKWGWSMIVFFTNDHWSLVKKTTVRMNMTTDESWFSKKGAMAKVTFVTTMISYHVFQFGNLLNIVLRWRWQQLDRYIL